MSALIEPSELASYMRRPELDSDPAVIVACQLASGAVRDHTHQELSYVADDTMTWYLRPYAPGPDSLLLPEFPVTAISSLTRNGDTLVEHDDFEFDDAGSIAAYRTTFYGAVHVTYDHGHEVIPEGLRSVLLAVGTRLFDNPARDVNRAVGSHNESYTVDFTLNEQHILARYSGAKRA